jgi:hypothetical protein
MKSEIINGKLRRTILTKEEMKNISILKPEIKEKRDAYLRNIKASMKAKKESDGSLIVEI